MAYKPIEMPSAPSGNEREKIDQIYRYLVRMTEDLNLQLEQIGGSDLTDEERLAMAEILGGSSSGDTDSLKALIFRTMTAIKNTVDELKAGVLRKAVQDGSFGRYVKGTEMTVPADPAGATKTAALESAVSDLSGHDVTNRNCIKAGVLRTVSDVPVVGVAIGKDVVTFSRNAQGQWVETYNDANKVAEFSEGTAWLQGIEIGLDNADAATGGGRTITDEIPILFTDGDMQIGKSLTPVSLVFADTVHYRYLVEDSSLDVKEKIRTMEDVGEKLDRLVPVRFVYKDDPEKAERMGLIWEQTVGVLPEICVGDGANKAINYTELVPVLVKEIQQLRRRVRDLERGGN